MVIMASAGLLIMQLLKYDETSSCYSPLCRLFIIFDRLFLREPMMQVDVFVLILLKSQGSLSVFSLVLIHFFMLSRLFIWNESIASSLLNEHCFLFYLILFLN